MDSRLRYTLIVSLLLGSSLFMGCVPSYVQQANALPVNFTYTRPGTSISIPVLGKSGGADGFSDLQKTVITDVLNQLPVSHIATVGRIAGLASSDIPPTDAGLYYKDQRLVIINMGINLAPFDFRGVLLHEIGHAMGYQLLKPAQVNEFNNLHYLSKDPEDYASPIAQSGTDELDSGGDDFAETYRALLNNNTKQLEDLAVKNVIQGHTLLLQKFLFTVSLFANDDQTINFYTTPAQIFIPFTFLPRFQVERRAYELTSDALSMGDYTYHLNGHSIISIEDAKGAIVADHLNIPVPQMIYDRLHVTSIDPALPPVPPLLEQPTALSISADAPLTQLQSAAGSTVVSPFPPTHYGPVVPTPIDPKIGPTLHDLYLPHGDFDVTTPPTP